jgi:DNA-binding response OmpR family regulator
MGGLQASTIKHTAGDGGQQDSKALSLGASIPKASRPLHFLKKEPAMGLKNILVVDDEMPIRNVLKNFFQRSGYDILTAESGQKAREILNNGHVAVMFLDLHLPDADGFDLCREFKGKNTDCAIFALTGDTGRFNDTAFRDAGFDAVFRKPISCGMLLKATEAIL